MSRLVAVAECVINSDEIECEKAKRVLRDHLAQHFGDAKFERQLIQFLPPFLHRLYESSHIEKIQTRGIAVLKECKDFWKFEHDHRLLEEIIEFSESSANASIADFCFQLLNNDETLMPEYNRDFLDEGFFDRVADIMDEHKNHAQLQKSAMEFESTCTDTEPQVVWFLSAAYRKFRVSGSCAPSSPWTHQ